MKYILLLLIGLTTHADNFVARVIYSEAGPSVSAQERYLVASVIKNRINHNGFGKKKTMNEIVNVKNAFECINHNQNQNWKMSGEIEKHLSNKRIKNAWYHSKTLAKGDFTPQSNVHFFLTKGTKVPNNFVATKYWKLTKVKTTKHFDFYSIKAK